MGCVAIRAENLSKRYTIGAVLRRQDQLTDALGSRLRRLVGAEAKSETGETTLWALQDVNLEIMKGETVGIIGRNGSGKSTLLKILSRITEPTRGRAVLYGSFCSLLEVGTGFHPELTGRDNIYLSGAILGMKKAEIDKRFDEIVSFAEVEKFVDTPIKHYSSGMHMRLGFAVVAHLEPDILIVDEVLAVGDGRFQNKCLNKMEETGEQGRTVVFVSHDMAAVTRLCKKAIVLDGGRVVREGAASQVVGSYLTAGSGTSASCEWTDASRAPGGEVARLRAVQVQTDGGVNTHTVDIRRPVGIRLEYDVLKPGYVLSAYFDLYNQEGIHVFGAADQDAQWRRRPRPLGRWSSTAWIPGNLLSEGTHYVSVGLSTMAPMISQFEEAYVVSFHVTDGQEGDSARGDWGGHWKGAVRPLLPWTTARVSE